MDEPDVWGMLAKGGKLDVDLMNSVDGLLAFGNGDNAQKTQVAEHKSKTSNHVLRIP